MENVLRESVYYYDGVKVTVKQTRKAEPMGEYTETSIDQEKKEVDFRLVSTSPYYIIWKDGTGEDVNKRRLTKLQKEFTWATDF